MKVLFFNLNNKDLPVYHIKSNSLLPYTTTLSDIKQGRSRFLTLPYQSREFDEDLFLDKSEPDAKIVIGAWKIRGPTQAVRFLLEYIGVKYVDKMYEMGGYPDYDKSSWESVKDKIGFGLLKGFPYLIDGQQRK